MPCDLYLEHLNRRLKFIITRMESNIQPSSIIRAARAIGVVNQICQTFRDEMSVQSTSDIQPSHTENLNIILDVLKEKHL